MLALTGELRIEHAAELATRLAELVASPDEVHVDWSAAEHLDGSVLQLLAAFTRARVSRGARVTFATPPAALARYLALSGFAPHLVGSGGAA